MQDSERLLISMPMAIVDFWVAKRLQSIHVSYEQVTVHDLITW